MKEPSGKGERRIHVSSVEVPQGKKTQEFLNAELIEINELLAKKGRGNDGGGDTSLTIPRLVRLAAQFAGVSDICANMEDKDINIMVEKILGREVPMWLRKGVGEVKNRLREKSHNRPVVFPPESF